MKHKSIFERLDGCWSDSWDSLTDEQQDAWKAAAFTNAVPKVTTRIINEAGVVRVENVVAPAMDKTPWIAWDWLTPEQRQSHARQHDATHALCDPIAEARAFDLVFQLDDAEKTAARLREAAKWSTGQDHSEDIRNAEKAEAEAARIRAELDCIEQRGENETAESPDPDESTPATERRRKKALIDELEGEWPSIEADLSEASRAGNWLRPAKLPEHGYWDKSVAVKLAVENGKMKSPTLPGKVDSGLAAQLKAATKKHRIK